MYAFTRRPLWVLSHVLVVLGVLVMVRLGLWQMSRWHEESDNRDRIEASLEAEPAALAEVVEAGADPSDVPESARYRRVLLRGSWLGDETVVIRNRSLDGSPGGWLATPLLQPDGTAVAVVRGWVDLDLANGGAPFPGTEPPAGEVVVVGPVMLTQQRAGLGPADPAEGALDSFARLDLERWASQLDVPLAPVWVMAADTEPPEGAESVRPLEPEVPSPSQNFSYMVQWWIFATIAAGGYLLVLRKVAQSKSGPSQVPLDLTSNGESGGRSNPGPDGPRDVHAGV